MWETDSQDDASENQLLEDMLLPGLGLKDGSLYKGSSWRWRWSRERWRWSREGLSLEWFASSSFLSFCVVSVSWWQLGDIDVIWMLGHSNGFGPPEELHRSSWMSLVPWKVLKSWKQDVGVQVELWGWWSCHGREIGWLADDKGWSTLKIQNDVRSSGSSSGEREWRKHLFKTHVITF